MEEKTSCKERRVSKKNEGEERRLEEERKGKSGAIQARVAKKKEKRKSLIRVPVGSRAKKSSDALFSDKTARLLGSSPETFARRIKATLFTAWRGGALSRGEGKNESFAKEKREYGFLSRG